MAELTPSASLSDEIVDALNQQDPKTLILVAPYAEQLAEYRDEVAPAEDDDEEESRETPEKWEGTDEDWNNAFTGRDEAGVYRSCEPEALTPASEETVNQLTSDSEVDAIYRTPLSDGACLDASSFA